MGLRALALCLILLPGLAFARCEGFVPGARPQNSPREFIGATLDEITERGWIEFAVYEGFPPYSYEEGGQPKGIDIEIGKLIAAGLGVTPRFRFVLAGETLDADLLYNVWKGSAVDNHVSNVMLRVPYNSDYACRVDQVVFTGQYASEKIAIAYAKAAYPDADQKPDADGRHKDAPVPGYFRYDSVAVENDSIADFYLTSLPGGGLAEHLHRYPSMAEAMQALRQGEVMAAMGPLSQLEAGADASVAVHTPPLPGFSAGKWTLGVAVSQQHRDLGYAIDDAIAAGLADGRIARIYAEFGADFIPPER
jgi:ABC-type amino acid transport substrate-binding protein